MERNSNEFDLNTDLKNAVIQRVNAVFENAKPVHDLTERKISYAVECTLDITKEAFGVKKEKRVEYAGFGTFKLRVKKGRKRTNPATGETAKDDDGNELKTPDTYTIKFKPAPAFLEALQSAFGDPK